MDLGLQGKTFLITGGSRGLGFATAAALAADGARTILVARDEFQLINAARLLGPEHRTISADLSSTDAAKRIADIAGELDGTLVNVGGPAPGAVLDLDDDQWRRAIDGTFLAPLRLTRELVSGIRDGGAMLVVLSTTVKEPIPSLGASNALRPGLAMTVKDLANTLAPRVRVNGILPGRIATDRLREVFAGDLASGIPMGRPGSPEEFGRVAAFLLSPAASYMTGTLVTVDGGLLRSPW
ncbi:MAG: 3-oxoacyl-[acyl-carrier-protein] reductase [Actinomycetota bacterium]|jgi:3-oxoacyl-[acyl-carrier protein] reductase